MNKNTNDKSKSPDQKIAILRDRMFNLLYKYPYANTRKAVRKIETELRYYDDYTRARGKVKEEVVNG